MSNAPESSRVKTALVVALILLPLALTAVLKYRPAVIQQQKVSSIAVLHPRLYVPSEMMYLDDDVVKRLRSELGGIPGVELRDTPPGAETRVGDDLVKAAAGVNAAALVVSTVTIDSGIVQLNLQLIDPGTRRILFNTPYQSSVDRYPDMMVAAGAGLKRALQ